MQWAACPWRSWIIRQHFMGSAIKALAYGSPGRGIGAMAFDGRPELRGAVIRCAESTAEA